MRISSFVKGRVLVLSIGCRAWPQAELFRVQMETVGQGCTNIFPKAGRVLVICRFGSRLGC